MVVTIIFATPRIRRVVRVVEGARLESVYTRKGIEGSNPSLSAISLLFVLVIRVGSLWWFLTVLELHVLYFFLFIVSKVVWFQVEISDLDNPIQH